MNSINFSALFSKSVLLLFCILFCFANCSEKSKAADTPPDLSGIPNFSGKWILEGEGDILIDTETKTVTLKEERLVLEMDSLGVRIRPDDRENAIGYFLFSEIKDKTWIGT